MNKLKGEFGLISNATKSAACTENSLSIPVIVSFVTKDSFSANRFVDLQPKAIKTKKTIIVKG